VSTKLTGTRRILSKEDGIGIFGSWVYVIVYCSFAFYIFYVFGIGSGEVFVVLITGFFAASGVVYIVLTIHFTMNRLKFGEVHLHLPFEKPAPGGELAGSVTLPARAAQANHVRVELRCLKVVIGTDDKGRTTTKQEREWYQEKFFVVRRRGGGAEVEFRMTVPDEPVISRSEPYVWEVQVMADLPGVDLSRSFVIEMGRATGPPRVAATPAADAEALPSPKPASAPPDAGLATAQAYAMPRAARPAVPTPVASRTAMAAALPAAAAPQVRKRVPESPVPVAALIGANLLPLAGALFLGWTVAEIVLLYWLENVIIGLMNLARIAVAEPDALTRNAPPGKQLRPHELLAGKIFLGGFFLVHFGAFCAAHATVLADLFPVTGPDGRRLEIGGVIADMLTDPVSLATVLALFASHLTSFFRNYLGLGEYRHTDIGKLMTRPYGRIFVLHLFIIGSGLVASSMNSHIAAMVLFVVIKTAVDLRMHRRERDLLSGP
jgi:hypothetical protein